MLKLYAWLNKQPSERFVAQNRKREGAGGEKVLSFHQADLQTNDCYCLAVVCMYLLCRHGPHEASVLPSGQGQKRKKNTLKNPGGRREDSDRQGAGGKTDLSAL